MCAAKMSQLFHQMPVGTCGFPTRLQLPTKGGLFLLTRPASSLSLWALECQSHCIYNVCPSAGHLPRLPQVEKNSSAGTVLGDYLPLHTACAVILIFKVGSSTNPLVLGLLLLRSRCQGMDTYMCRGFTWETVVNGKGEGARAWEQLIRSGCACDVCKRREGDLCRVTGNS